MSYDGQSDSSTPAAAPKPGVQNTKQANNEWQILEKLALGSLAEQTRARRWGIAFKLLTFAYLFIALALFYPWGSEGPSLSGNEKHTAVVKLAGMISPETDANANTFVSGLRKAFKDPNTQGIIIAINSPGGSPVQSGYMYDEIKRLREEYKDTPIYAVISDTGASGAYYVAAAADEIWAEKASMVGSIGVVSSDFGFVELMEKIGVERRLFTAGENKAFLDSYSPIPPEHKAYWQEMLGVIHAQFITAVRTGRGDRLKDDPSVFSGLVWSGEQALELGLVDGLGSAGHVAREIIGAEKIVDFSVAPHPLDRLVKQLGVSMGEVLVQHLLSQPRQFSLQ